MSSGPNVLRDLPAELVSKQASRATIVAPPPDTWLLLAASATPAQPTIRPSDANPSVDDAQPADREAPVQSGGTAHGGTDWQIGNLGADPSCLLFVDVDKKGRVMGAEEAAKLFPAVAEMLRSCSTSAGGEDQALADQVRVGIIDAASTDL